MTVSYFWGYSSKFHGDRSSIELATMSSCTEKDIQMASAYFIFETDCFKSNCAVANQVVSSVCLAIIVYCLTKIDNTAH